uniref:Complex 1 LYR protein domain-containing protein n=1 Tax=Tetraselmis chuii TaxID=63592 RepID=A0A7S1T4E1_9CHLO|mmetsp:Transcript_5604/g.10063  ORF Transcript_5604/g.10063 Transcript_5604/m.10063 type:complete len:106 (+) Transcript_5604:288-605(+)
MNAAKRPLSGLQRQVLALYRSALRTAREKPADQRKMIEDYARDEFQKNLSLSKTDYMRIEHMIRKGSKQLELLNMPQTTGVHVSPTPHAGAGGHSCCSDPNHHHH